MPGDTGRGNMADEHKLQAIFNDNGPEAPAPAQETAPAPEAAAAAPAETPPVVESAPAPTQGQEDDEASIGPVPYKRFKAVNEERHELRRQLAEREGRLSALEQSRQQANPQQPTTPQPSLEDRWFTDGVGLHKETNGRIDQLEKQLGFLGAETVFRQQHTDYDANRAAFEKAANDAIARGDMTLVMRMRSAKDPVKFVYDEGAMIREMDGIESPAQYRDKVRKEIESEIEQRVRKELSLASAASASTTNAGARSSGVTTAPVFRETPDKDVFPGVMR